MTLCEFVKQIETTNIKQLSSKLSDLQWSLQEIVHGVACSSRTLKYYDAVFGDPEPMNASWMTW